jgi:hypothetical protein
LICCEILSLYGRVEYEGSIYLILIAPFRPFR